MLKHILCGIAGLAAGWLFLPTPLWICGVYQKSSAPAWVQAIGSIVAILAAGGIAYWQMREHYRRDQLKTDRKMHVMRRFIRSDLESIWQECEAVLSDLEALGSNPSEDEIDNAIYKMILYAPRDLIAREDKFTDLTDRELYAFVFLLKACDEQNAKQGYLHTTRGPERYNKFKELHLAMMKNIQKIKGDALHAALYVRQEMA